MQLCDCFNLLARLSVTSQIPKTFQPSKQQEGVSSLTSVKTHQHYIIIITVLRPLKSTFLMFFLSVLCPDVTVTSDGAWSSYLSLYRERQGEK